MMRKLLGYCACCRRWFTWPKRRRLNTAYVDDSMNFMTSCKDCYDDAVRYYNELWEDYYSGRL